MSNILKARIIKENMLFVISINVGLRAGDLLKLKVKDVLINRDMVGSILIKEQKTGKGRELTLNRGAKDAIKYYLSSITEYIPEDYLFRSKKGGGRLTVQATHKIIKGALRELNVKVTMALIALGRHGLIIYMNNAKDNPLILPTIQKMLNHSNQAITLKYIGITKEVITDIYNSINL
ncbi:tyrosine-type recombinase/integrase [Clostridium frigoris]|uniref:Tyrosine-type recombinase/integrase n=1 Tax=Clostridium frigoris TaxID=205327 RepID=A0ABS6BXL6_9CLOT|nr:tyrosine-type recombinase/integrase [Clostridium frigoris]MBU3161351.1 tyrosine-type recombinase/integrase [Clostridium frigoris]